MLQPGDCLKSRRRRFVILSREDGEGSQNARVSYFEILCLIRDRELCCTPGATRWIQVGAAAFGIVVTFLLLQALAGRSLLPMT